MLLAHPSSSYLDYFASQKFGSIRSRRVLPRYLEWAFDGVPLSGQTLYDVGGGTGLISFYAAEQGASEVVCVEPLGDGSHDSMLNRFELAQKTVRNGQVVRLENTTLEDFSASHPPLADVLVLHNVVNHLDEDSCRTLHTGNPSARSSFLHKFGMLSSLLKHGGVILVADAGRESFWSSLGLPNPFAPTIDRSVHQEPEVWASLLSEAGFEQPVLRWTPFIQLLISTRSVYPPIRQRSLSAYYTLGHFVLTMSRI